MVLPVLLMLSYNKICISNVNVTYITFVTSALSLFSLSLPSYPPFSSRVVEFHCD